MSASSACLRAFIPLPMVLQAVLQELRMQQEQLSSSRHDKLIALRAYKAAEEGLAAAQEELPTLRIAK